MTSNNLLGASPYETWVRTLKAWSQDPTISLEHLPALQDDTYSPDTANRLLHAIIDAMSAVNERWLADLGRIFDNYRDPYELGRRLVQLRPAIARSMQLASHPSLPQTFRDALQSSVRSTIERNQREFEESFETTLRHSDLPKSTREQLLRTVRENSFVRALNHEAKQTGERLVAVALPEGVHDPVERQPRHQRRIIL